MAGKPPVERDVAPLGSDKTGPKSARLGAQVKTARTRSWYLRPGLPIKPLEEVIG